MKRAKPTATATQAGGGVIRAARHMLLAACLLAVAAPAATAEEYREAREAMVQHIAAHDFEAREALGPDGFSPRVLDALRRVPRHELVPPALRSRAYEDRPLPIGGGQTISQPFIVALMTHLAEPEPDHVVLEIGTGSGYQAAVLAHLVKRVYTIEIVPALAERARADLARLGYDNVEVRAGDGYEGWPEAGPFDSIVVTATAPRVPPRLVEQLKPGGRMVIPLGDHRYVQQLTLVEVDADGRATQQPLLPVRFVPLTREK